MRTDLPPETPFLAKTRGQAGTPSTTPHFSLLATAYVPGRRSDHLSQAAVGSPSILVARYACVLKLARYACPSRSRWLCHSTTHLVPCEDSSAARIAPETAPKNVNAINSTSPAGSSGDVRSIFASAVTTKRRSNAIIGPAPTTGATRYTTRAASRNLTCAPKYARTNPSAIVVGDCAWFSRQARSSTGVTRRRCWLTIASRSASLFGKYW